MDQKKDRHRMNLLDDAGETENGMYLSALADEPGEAEAAMVLNSLVDDRNDLNTDAERLIKAADKRGGPKLNQ